MKLPKNVLSTDDCSGYRPEVEHQVLSLTPWLLPSGSSNFFDRTNIIDLKEYENGFSFSLQYLLYSFKLKVCFYYVSV